MYISDKFLQFSVNECLKFRHILKINTCIVLCLWQLKHCFYLSHTERERGRERERERARELASERARERARQRHRLKFCNFLERSRNQIHEQLIQHWSTKFNTSEIQVFLMKTSDLIKILGKLREMN